MATKRPNIQKGKTDYRSPGVKAQPPVKIIGPKPGK
jgi:hypothetical protein